MCMSVLPAYIYLCTTCMPGIHGGQKRASDPLDLELLATTSPIWMLGTKLGPSERVLSALNHEANFSAPRTCILTGTRVPGH